MRVVRWCVRHTKHRHQRHMCVIAYVYVCGRRMGRRRCDKARGSIPDGCRIVVALVMLMLLVSSRSLSLIGRVPAEHTDTLAAAAEAGDGQTSGIVCNVLYILLNVRMHAYDLSVRVVYRGPNGMPCGRSGVVLGVV